MKKREPHSGDFELNLAPIIDCFTVLITYLLVSASFISLAVLDAGLAATSTGSGSATGTRISVNLLIQTDGAITVKASGGATFEAVPARKDGGWDMVALARRVEEMKARHSINEITVTAAPQVPYASLVRVVEVTKKLVGKVYLGSDPG